jgi:hypothetical protein
MALKIALDSDPETRWIAVLMGSTGLSGPAKRNAE